MSTLSRMRPVRQTVPMSEIGLLIEALDGIGGNVSDVLARSDLSYVRRHVQMHLDGEVPRAAFAKLFQECVVAFHLHSCRRDGFRPSSINAFRMMCLTMLACPTLGTAIEAAGAFQDMLHGGSGRLGLTTRNGVAHLSINANARRVQLSDIVVSMHSVALCAYLFSWLIGEEVLIRRIFLKSECSVDRHGFNGLLPVRPELGQPYDALEFSEAYLACPIVRKYDDLAELFPHFPFDLYATEQSASSLTSRVRMATRLAILHGEPIPDMGKLARMFGLTVSTFRRRIDAEATSLSQLRRACRQELAEKWLCQGQLSVSEIASRLQFSDTPSFRRAFRSWTGKSPFSYRSQETSSSG